VADTLGTTGHLKESLGVRRLDLLLDERRLVKFSAWSTRGTEKNRTKMASDRCCDLWNNPLKWAPFHSDSSRLGGCSRDGGQPTNVSGIPETLQIVGRGGWPGQ